VAIKSVLDTSFLNHTLGPKTVERDSRSEYQGKRVSDMVRQPAFREVSRLECSSCQFNSRESEIAITTSYELDYQGIEVHYPRWQSSFSSPMHSDGLRGPINLLPSRNGDMSPAVKRQRFKDDPSPPSMNISHVISQASV
jgi:hypothetical protein